MGYIADALKLRAGSIVKIEAPRSSTGGPAAPHYFVVVIVPARPRPGDSIVLVGVSSGIAAADPARHIAMKWLGRPGGNPETGFTRPCPACVDFIHVLEVYAGTTYSEEVKAEHAGRYVRSDKLKAIAAALSAWTSRED